jgi:hypothetical protein
MSGGLECWTPSSLARYRRGEPNRRLPPLAHTYTWVTYGVLGARLLPSTRFIPHPRNLRRSAVFQLNISLN